MKSRSRTIITRVIAFLLLGAIVNIAVAWGLAIFAPMRYTVSHCGVFIPTTVPNWDVAVISRTGAVLVDANASATMARNGPVDPKRIPHWSMTSTVPSELDAQQDRSIQEIAYGWPQLTFFSRNSWNRRHEWGLVIPWFSKYDSRILPLRPLWPGFAINTIFYAAVLALVFFVPRKVRRFVRVRRGRCPACAYPVGSSPVCTECGAALPARWYMKRS
jgi:hypothetical protein